MYVLEIVKTLGSFVGLLTGVVFFYDRLAKGRPVAYLYFKDNEDRSAYLSVENPSTYGIAATLHLPYYSLDVVSCLSTGRRG